MKAMYYVYAYLDPRKPGKYAYEKISFLYEPFYIGKGKNNRYLAHLTEGTTKKGFNPHKTRKIRKIIKHNMVPIITKLYQNTSEEEAHKIEIEIISMIGRNDKRKGPLTNMTDGGDGVNKIISEKQKLKISIALKKYYDNHPEIKLIKSIKMTGHKQSKSQVSKRISTIKTIKNFNDNFKKKYLITTPKGISFEIFGLQEFCINNNLYYPCMARVASGNRSHHKGWKVVKI